MFFLKVLPSQEMVDGFAQIYPEVEANDVMDALAMMRQASVLVREIELYFVGHGLSQLRFLILMVIAREPDRDSLRIQEIIERIDVPKPVMTRTLLNLQQEELISISQDEKDKRGRLVSLTGAGDSLFRNVLPGYFSLISKYMNGLKNAVED